MTSLTNKLQHVAKRLQQLTVWRPNDQDPFNELERWRTDVYRTIEQVYFRKRAQIERMIEKHEREFMRQIVRQKSMLNSIHRRVADKTPTSLNGHDQSALFADLRRVETEIDTRLGRGEIIIETNPLQLDDSVIVHLKTYFSLSSSSVLVKDMPAIDQRQKPIRRSVDQATRACETWKRTKDDEHAANCRGIPSATQQKLLDQKQQQDKTQKAQEAFDDWKQRKERDSGFIKKKDVHHDNGLNQEALLT